MLLKIKEELETLANPDIAAHSQRFFKTDPGEYGEGDIFIGIRVPVLRKIAAKYKTISRDDSLIFLKSRIHEERLLALIMLVNRYKKSSETEKKAIYSLYMNHLEFVNNWDLVDSSAPYIPGEYLYKRDRKILYSLAISESMWERRVAILSTFYFIKMNDFKDTLTLSKLLLNDKEDILHKAVGWMLRELGNRDRSEEENFLKKYYKIMPRTMLRYAIEKFPEALRQDYLKGRV